MSFEAVLIGTTHQISMQYPASQAQLVPSQLDPARFKIPSRGRVGMFGFTCVDFKDNDLVRQFNGNRCVVVLQTSRAGVLYYTSVLYDWDCQVKLTIPEGDTPQTLVADDRTFRYSLDYPGGGGSSEAPYTTVTPFAGGETSVALAYFDPINDVGVTPPGATIVVPTGPSFSYWGSASGINQTT
jgi:hypothetical protein